MNEEKNKTKQEKTSHFTCDKDGFLGKGFPPNRRRNLYATCKKCIFVFPADLEYCPKCGKKKHIKKNLQSCFLSSQ